MQHQISVVPSLAYTQNSYNWSSTMIDQSGVYCIRYSTKPGQGESYRLNWDINIASKRPACNQKIRDFNIS